MLDYLYDGSFEGFLSCIYAHYYDDRATGIYPWREYQASLLARSREIETDGEKAAKVYDAIENKISPNDIKRVYRVFLSNDPDKETKLLKYIALGFKTGPAVSRLHGDPVVFSVQTIDRKITTEVHRLCGLVRFTVLSGGTLYSQIEPDHDVCGLLVDHFCERFKNDPFIIHDKGREKALVAYKREFYIAEFHDRELPEPSKDEEEFRMLWRNYFSAIAIKERVNPRCQRNFMPVRYWKNLTEMRR